MEIILSYQERQRPGGRDDCILTEESVFFETHSGSTKTQTIPELQGPGAPTVPGAGERDQLPSPSSELSRGSLSEVFFPLGMCGSRIQALQSPRVDSGSLFPCSNIQSRQYAKQVHTALKLFSVWLQLESRISRVIAALRNLGSICNGGQGGWCREEASTRHLNKMNPFSVLTDLDCGTQMWP